MCDSRKKNNLENNSNFTTNNKADENKQNTEVFKRSSSEELRGSDENTIGAKISDRLRRSVETAKSELNGKELPKHKQEDLEKRIAFEYAKENGLWYDNLYSLGQATGLGGNENTLALDNENNVLFKSNNLFNSQFLISQLLEQVKVHNWLFPETRYEVIGLTGIDHGKNKVPYIEVILKQAFVRDASNAMPQEISNFMESLGFEKINDSSYTNGKYTVSDLHPRNVLKDKNGFIHIVDNIISENKSK